MVVRHGWLAFLIGKQVHPDDQQLSDKYVALFVATTGTPHAALKNKFLKKAFRALGATCPSPKRVKTLIQDVYLQTRRTVEADLSSLFEAGMAVMMCTDGWRHRHAAQGHPLLNLVLLKPSSGVWFFDCYPLDRGAKKDARFYADMHNEMANKVQLISKVLGDCVKIRNALNCAQMTKYNKIQAVATHCATRFAILYLICVDLKRSQDALVMMVHAATSWWRKLDAVIRLMRPISNAIHRLEGDKPYLSQVRVLKIWDDLVAHAQNWVSELGHPGGLDKVDASFVRGVLRIFKDRAQKHCQPVMAAARLLDPINFFDMGEHAQPPFDSLSEQQQADLAPTVSRLAGASLGAALRELNAFENADWNPAMKRRAQSMLQMQTLQQPTQPGQPSFTPIASIEARRAFWKLQAAPQFPILAKASQRLLLAHASTAAAERNWSVWGHTYHNALRNNLSVEVAKREVYLKANVPTTDSDDEAPAVQDTLIDIMKVLLTLRRVLPTLFGILPTLCRAAPVPPATAAGVGPLSYAGALTAAPILPEVGTSAAAAATDEIQRLRQQLVGVTAHLEAAQNEAVRVRAELSEMESLQDRQNVVVSGEKGVAAIRSQSDRPVVNRSSGTSAALPALGAAPALSGTVAPVAPLSGRQTPLSQVAPPAKATLAAPVPMSRVKIPGPDKWTDQCLATSRVAEIFCEDLEVHCAYLRIDPADALPNFLTGKAREVWYPATRNAHILAHGSRPTWVHLRAAFKEMAGDDLRNESDVHRRKLLDPNALRMSAGSTLNAYITDFRNTLTVAGSTCMAPAMLVATFIRGLTSELQSSVVHDLALMRDPTLNDAIQAAVNAQKVLFAVATNHVGRRPPAPHVAAFVPHKQINRIRTFPGPAGGPPPPAPRGPYWDVSSSSSSGGHRGSRHSSQGGGRHAGRAAQAPPATAPVCPAPAAGGSTLPNPGYACHHCWNPNHFRDYCNLKHLPADEARRVSGYPRPASLGPPSRHANPPGDLPPRPQKRDRSPPGKGGWKQQGSRGDRRH
ncbi:hypothetical protein QJQ45_015326 [Haematococcus lacustris]|nr:hypothetical protein QJQ45_015326 [Haematococcus lacustris]